jgi:KDO2-lipid IV(A) lauroyltransferase
MIVEIAHAGRTVRTDNWREFIEFATPDQARICLTTLLCGRPVLIVTGHFGNWELSCYVLGLLGFPGYAIARPLDNPFVDSWLRRWREQTGSKMIAKKGDFDRIEEVLKAGNILATLGDQDAGARGIFVDFFNRAASTHKAVALLAIEHNVPMLVTGTVRVGMKYRLCIEDLIEPGEFADRIDPVRAITERFTSALERMIRRHPEQYFWLHRRWKHQPPVRKKKAA